MSEMGSAVEHTVSECDGNSACGGYRSWARGLTRGFDVEAVERSSGVRDVVYPLIAERAGLDGVSC
jgi:hypothetical protein